MAYVFKSSFISFLASRSRSLSLQSETIQQQPQAKTTTLFLPFRLMLPAIFRLLATGDFIYLVLKLVPRVRIELTPLRFEVRGHCHHGFGANLYVPLVENLE